MYYCNECNKNLCHYCARETSEHINHKINMLYEKLYGINLKIEDIKEKFGIKEDLDKKDDEYNSKTDNDDINNIKNLFKIIINDYKKYPNYSHFIFIENLYESLFFKPIEISSISDYKYIKDFTRVSSINIQYQHFNDLSLLCNSTLPNLEKLVLIGNNIINIKPLKNANFPKLKYLNLEKNKIDDTNIETIKEFKFQKLLELNLSFNCISNYKIFKIVEILENLEILLIEKNKIIKEYNNDDDIQINSKKINEIGLSGVFSDLTINLLSKFNFDNLKIIYLNRNNLHSLNFVNNLKFEQLEEIWLNNNLIEEFFPLSKLKNLKKIYLKNNQINYIGNIEKFIKTLKKLQLMNLEGNYIDKKNEENIDIIKYIKKLGNIII